LGKKKEGKTRERLPQTAVNWKFLSEHASNVDT